VAVSLSISPIEDNHGQVVGAATIARDISAEQQRRAELLALEAQFLQAQKMESLGQLAGGVAHDFNNLLVAIRGYTELLLAESTGRTAQRADEILKAADHAASLTRQLLAFSRQAASAPGPLDLNELVDDSARMFRRLLGSRIELVYQPAEDDDIAVARGDSSQLQQVLLNLVVNARDAMLPTGGTLGIKVRSVTLDAAGARCQCRRPARRLRRGREPGAGSRFAVHLPASDELPARKLKLERPPRGSGESIVVVEDERTVRALVQEMLEENGHRVFATDDPEEALRLLDTDTECDLLVTDFSLPRLTGSQLVEAARVRRPALKALVMSGLLAEPGPHMEVTCDQFIAKPFAVDELLAKVRHALDAT
jgi:two-component system cell cycle sensor histidine kinase/response regulator CckA